MPAPADSKDRENFLQLQQDDPEALNRIINRWQGPLHKFAYQYVRNAYDAQDLVAETISKLYLHRNRLRPDTNLSAWLFTALSNLCCNQHRWKKRHPTISLDAPARENRDQGSVFQDKTKLDPNQILEADEDLIALRQAIEKLPHDLRTTLLLHHYSKFTYKEISLVLHCSVRGVETRLYRAKHKLRSILAPHLADGGSESHPIKKTLVG